MLLTPIRGFIIHQIFSLARDWSKRVTWEDIPQFLKPMDNKHNSLNLAAKIRSDICPRTLSVPRSSQLRQMKAIVYVVPPETLLEVCGYFQPPTKLNNQDKLRQKWNSYQFGVHRIQLSERCDFSNRQDEYWCSEFEWTERDCVLPPCVYRYFHGIPKSREDVTVKRAGLFCCQIKMQKRFNSPSRL